MFKRGKSNQGNIKGNGWNGISGRSWDPIVEWIPCLYGTEREDELELIPDPFLVDHFIGSLRNDTLSHSSSVFN